jgi:Flp pilus assembly protein TadD
MGQTSSASRENRHSVQWFCFSPQKPIVQIEVSSMKPVLAILAICSLLLLGGCGSPAVSLHPLYLDKEKPATETGIEGTWLAEDNSAVDAIGWNIRVDSSGCYQAESEQKNSEANKQKETEIYKICLVRLQEKLFFDEEFISKNIGAAVINANDLGQTTVRGHNVGRLWLEKDMLRVAQITSKWVEQNMPEGQRAMQDKTAIITASTDDLRKFLSEHAEDSSAWSSYAYLCRLGTDCNLRATADRLVRYPDDTEILANSAVFFIGRGDYDKATGLLQHAEQVAPDKPFPHLLLALTRLPRHDFNGIRRELALAQKLDKENPENYDSFFGLSYFLEGNFQEASRIFAKAHTAEKTPTAGPILFNYFALARGGHRKEADAFLAKETARFTGSPEDQVLLLEAAGRVTNPPWSQLGESANKDNTFLYAQNCVVQGDVKAARAALESIVKNSGDDVIQKLMAKAELERLQ